MSSLSRSKKIDSSKTYSQKSMKTEESTLMCSACKFNRQELIEQINSLKDKAHQSFMQVIQIQQLHEEQIQQLRQEFEEKQQQFQQKISKLSQQNSKTKSEICLLQRNVKHHSYDYNPKQLVIDNIDAIICKQDEISHLDESQLMQFRDIVSIRNSSEYIHVLRNQIYKDVKFVSNSKTQIQKLFIIIKQFKEENANLSSKCQTLMRQFEEAEKGMKQAKNINQSLSKESKFMTEHLKRINNDKIKLEQQIKEQEGRIKQDKSREKSRQKERMQLLGTHPGIVTITPPPSGTESQATQKSINFLEISKYTNLDHSGFKQGNQLNYAQLVHEDPNVQDNSNIIFKRKGSGNLYK